MNTFWGILSPLLPICSHLKHTKHSICFAFLFFLRLSNILPHTTSGFDVSRHLCVGDIIFSSLGATIVVKWSKTIEDRVSTATVAIPYLSNSLLCPIIALKTMLSLRAPQTNELWFQLQSDGHWKVLTDSVVRKHLKHVYAILQLPRSLTFHDFRRWGATWAFLRGVPIQQIQAQGTWSFLVYGGRLIYLPLPIPTFQANLSL